MKILTSSEDDFLYEQLLRLLEQIKLVQSGTALSSTLRRHSKIKIYMIEKQIEKIKHIEETYFDNKGLNQLAIDSYNQKSTLHNSHNNVN